MMQTNKNAVLYLIIIFSLFRNSYSHAMDMSGDAASGIANTAASTIGQEAIKEALKNIAIPLCYISLSRELYVLGKDTKSLVLPNKEEQASTLAIKKEMRLIKARRAFENCLINAHNKSSSSSDDCAKEEYMFALLAGKEKASNKKAIFNKYKKK